MTQNINRRTFLHASGVVAAGLGLPPWAAGADPPKPPVKLAAKADAMILIWLPGGVTQTDTWDLKKYTPYRAGMKGSELLGTCEAIPTAADGIVFGQGLEQLATVMDKGTVLRSLTSETKFGAVHLKAQHYLMTGYLFPVGVKAPGIGAVVARTRGRRDPNVPPYIYLGRDIDTSDDEKLFINDYIGPGFYGVNYAPFMIPEPAKGLATLNVLAGMSPARFDERQNFLKRLGGLVPPELRTARKPGEYLKALADARAMMDSPVKKAFDYRKDETPATLKAYQPAITGDEVLDKSYYHGHQFGEGLLLARRLVESGARFVQVEYQYAAFKGFDIHENSLVRLPEMKRQIDQPIAQLIRDLDQRGLLERTLVVIATEFGRTVAAQPAAGTEPDGCAERHTGAELVIENEKMFGFHGHFSSCSSMLFFGGGFKKGFAYGKTAPEHPMVAIENPVKLEDVHATIYQAMGIPPDTAYVTEGRPFYVTKDGKGEPISALLA